MKPKIIALILLCLLLVPCAMFGYYQVQRNLFNLTFAERDEQGKPAQWGCWTKGSSYSCDSGTVPAGKYSLHVKVSKGDGSPGIGASVISQSALLAHVRGTNVTYSGWIKTKNVARWAGLWMRVDGRPPGQYTGKILASNNMQDSAWYGTHDWRHFSFVLPVSDTAKNVDFGVQVAGSGEAWFAGLTLDTNGVRLAP
ncbi:MAG: hypothetical protein Q8922_08200 [Bacteroidota bacterium]|nr:hypothetical protein [Bacteroidota bacterium]MDP4234205.1 hypothetical protein [Bacteroidota bacterium]MDP4243729.1 hypothetical protein [Bacteroidota bacterium]MDP4287906.1 hypothetical protein [Bacteroidota bacterium]